MFKQILVPVDLSHTEQLPRLMDAVSRLAHTSEANVCLIYVDKSLEHKAGSPQIDTATYHNHVNENRQQLTALLKTLDSQAFTLTALIREGCVHDQILEEVNRRNVDAVVMMARKPGISSYFIGSSAERVVRHAACSVFVLRE